MSYSMFQLCVCVLVYILTRNNVVGSGIPQVETMCNQFNVTSYLWDSGEPTLSSEMRMQFGTKMIVVGDIDNNGVEDYAVSAMTNRGWVTIILNDEDPTTKEITVINAVSHQPAASLSPLAPDAECFVGTGLAPIGDLNGDNIPDLAVTSRPGFYFDGACAKYGSMWILFLGSDGSIIAHDKVDNTMGGFAEAGGYFEERIDSDNNAGTGRDFGYNLAAVGDINGDNTVDLIGSVHNSLLPGNYDAWIFFLQNDVGNHPGTVIHSVMHINSTNGFHPSLSSELKQELWGPVETDTSDTWQCRVPYGFSPAGDFDNDGVPDVVQILATYDDYLQVALLGLDSSGLVIAIHIIPFIETNGYVSWPSILMVPDLDDNGVDDFLLWYETSGIFDKTMMMVSINATFHVMKTQTITLPQFHDGDTDIASWIFGRGSALLASLDADGFRRVAVTAPTYTKRNGPQQHGAIFILPLVPDLLNCNCSHMPYIGEFCEVPCENGGTNMNNGEKQYCDCTDTGHIGATCDKACPEGVDNNHIPLYPFTQCDCTSLNAIGTQCQNTCNNGVSNDLIGFTTCNCTGSGATGARCNKDEDDCASSPCLHGGACTDDGKELFPLKSNEYNCSCEHTGYYGDICDISNCMSSPCLHDGVCSIIQSEEEMNLLTCNCSHTGYEGDFCQTEIDECVSSPCLNDGICTDLLGDFSCSCVGTGYDGKTCAMDVDDCLSSPCLNDGVCQDKGVNSFKCNCNEFWAGDMCSEDVDDCILKGYYCENGAGCTDNPVNMGDVLCDCSAGTGGFTGKYCNVPIEDACVTFNPCFYGGKCILDDITKEVSCDCTDTGYEGDVCDVQVYVSECVSSPCLNEGQCYDPSDQQDDWYCECTNGYFGDLCDTTACDSMPCQNGGTCTHDDDAYTCACLENYAGIQCEINEDEQVGVLSSSSSSSNLDSNKDNDGAEANQTGGSGKNVGGTTFVIIVVAVILVVAIAIGWLYYKKQHVNSKNTFTMPT